MNWRDVHLELMRKLPVREHRQREPEPLNKGFYRGRHRHSTTHARHEAIVRLHGEGLSNQEIADELHVTTTTVRNHLKATK